MFWYAHLLSEVKFPLQLAEEGDGDLRKIRIRGQARPVGNEVLRHDGRDVREGVLWELKGAGSGTNLALVGTIARALADSSDTRNDGRVCSRGARCDSGQARIVGPNLVRPREPQICHGRGQQAPHERELAGDRRPHPQAFACSSRGEVVGAPENGQQLGAEQERVDDVPQQRGHLLAADAWSRLHPAACRSEAGGTVARERHEPRVAVHHPSE